jgi:hypothetical protein
MRDSAQPIVYFPRAHQSAEAQQMTLEARTSAPPGTLVPSLTKAIADINPRITLDVRTLAEHVSESLVIARSIATLSGFFGGLAILLATIGLYGIMAYTVARRRNEIGVRIALCAEQARVVRMVLGEVLAIVAAGMVLGLALSTGATRLVTSFLYVVPPDGGVARGMTPEGSNPGVESDDGRLTLVGASRSTSSRRTPESGTPRRESFGRARHARPAGFRCRDHARGVRTTHSTTASSCFPAGDGRLRGATVGPKARARAVRAT